jgi:antitoxin component of RelBE/YafQ-DinJ toxin-antitoxin module
MKDSTTLLRARLDQGLFDEATEVLRRLGRTPQDLVRQLFVQVVETRSIPLPILLAESEAYLEAEYGLTPAEAPKFKKALKRFEASERKAGKITSVQSCHELLK